MNYRRKVMIVDDSPVNRMIVSKILSDSFDVIEAENGLDALKILMNQAGSISLIILDIVMPVMDGYTFLESYSSIPQAGNIPVIVATQMDSEQDEVKALSAGAADFITKPYKPEVIRHRVANIIRMRENAAFINSIERDALTSLYTKEAFYTLAAEIIEHDPTNLFDIVCIDIENFHIVNDLYGEHEGDMLLCNIAQSLDAIVGSVGGIVSRFGGDVFAAILPVLDQLQWQEFVDEFQTKLKDQHIPSNVQVKYGIFRASDRSLSVRAMCDRAVQALSTIKGKYDVFHVYYDDEMGMRLKYELELASDMRRALSEQRFKVYYQPKYDLITEQIIGAEALVRWMHPEKGIISPAEFIPVFEANGFITQLDSFVWDTTCRDLRRWLDEGKKPMPVSVNVSRIDIYNESLPDILESIIHKYAIPINLLRLEITETAYVKNQQQLVRMVNRLKRHGFIIEMDDFGSGFSSLTMLSETPVDVIKLDMSLLANRYKSERSTSIIRFIINLADELGISVIAEGIETLDDLEYLKKLKCRYGQGFYFSKPLTADEYEKLMDAILMQPKDCLPKQAKTAIGSAAAEQSKGEMRSVVDAQGRQLDALTRLLHLSTFAEAAQKRLDECPDGNTLLVLNLDNFALVNENYGQKHCDDLLRSVAAFLHREFREDELISRVGSDEFAVFVSDGMPCESVCERMNGVCKRMIAQIGVSCSMGIALSEHLCAEFDVLYSNAVQAMREVKKTRKNGCAVYGKLGS